MPSWADHAIKKLNSGERAIIKPRGRSMDPKVKSGETVILEPYGNYLPNIGDIVLVKVSGRIFLQADAISQAWLNKIQTKSEHMWLESTVETTLDDHDKNTPIHKLEDYR